MLSSEPPDDGCAGAAGGCGAVSTGLTGTTGWGGGDTLNYSHPFDLLLLTILEKSCRSG